MLFLTVPTAGDRRDLLHNLVVNSGVPRENVIILATRPHVEVPPGVVLVEDFGSPNIQRWWLKGIEEAKARGAEYVAVVNDDVRIGPETLPTLAQALARSSGAIASPSRFPFRDGLHTRPLIPYEPRLWGSLWVLRIASGLLPDPRYVWWYGDNDLDIRARTRHGGVVLAPVEFEHLHPGEGTERNPELTTQASLDSLTFEAQYARLLRVSRMYARWSRRLGLVKEAQHAST